MAKYRVHKKPVMTAVTADQVVPIQPAPVFTTQTVHMRVVQGGFMDDMGRWHQAPPARGGFKDAVRINGIWYWACHIRDPHSGDVLLSRGLLFPSMP